MNKDYENVLEDLALVYRLKQQAEAHKKEVSVIKSTSIFFASNA